MQYTVSDGALSASALLTVNVAAAPTTLPTDNNATSGGYWFYRIDFNHVGLAKTTSGVKPILVQSLSW